MTYEPNTWVNFDGYVSLVIGVWQGNSLCLSPLPELS